MVRGLGDPAAAAAATTGARSGDGAAAPRPDMAQIWAWLAQVPDPEIPVISVIDLGIVRAVTWVGETLEVSVTPTYSGCPATAVIARDITEALRAQGLAQVRVRNQLSPPWTTDWLSDAGRAKLTSYGIAPPRASGGPRACPRCESADVELISAFGSTPCKAQWRCKSCLEPFDYFKCH